MNITAAVRSFSEEEVERLTAGPDATGEADAETEPPLSADDLFHLLQNSRRRAVIRYLRGHEEPMWMRDVAEQVAAWEHDTTVAELMPDQRQRVYIALYQSHLKTLEDAGVIEYDKPRGIIEPQPLLDRVALYVATATWTSSDADAADDPWSLGSPASTDTDTTSDPWSLGYLGVSLISTFLPLGIALDLAALEFLSGIAAGVLILLLFSVLTVARLTVDGGGQTG
jgi:hypothetical protein